MKHKVAIETIMIFFSMTLLDLAVVEGYYRPADAWNTIWIYQEIYDVVWVLVPLALAIYHKSWIPITLPVAFFFGLEDTSYYLFMLRLPSVYVGARIAGIFWQPSLNTVLLLNAVGLTLVGCIGYLAINRPISVSPNLRWFSACLRVGRRKHETRRSTFNDSA